MLIVKFFQNKLRFVQTEGIRETFLICLISLATTVFVTLLLIQVLVAHWIISIQSWIKKLFDPKNLSKIKVVRSNEKKLDEGPPCLETLMNMGIPEGGRDNALYQYAVYAKKAYPDAWKDKVNEFNSKHMDRTSWFFTSGENNKAT